MNKRQVLAALAAAPLIAFVLLLPPHHVTGWVEAHPTIDENAVSLSLGKSWVLRPHGSASSVTLDIDASVFSAVSHREYKLMVLPWIGNLLVVFALTGGMLFFLRTRKPKPAAPATSKTAPELTARKPQAPPRLAPLPPGMEANSKKNTFTITDF